ncbi:hypothetical protein EGW08_009867 [Elysia chlorotica]|uniref:Transmembrane protein 199 n=1 Tax=Elysia chlorotica TaxID=188477 RepID=A0A433TLA8_ELYCH|nr:hypothetical protein EGW08_009867 [Elysia chlorotica]
MADTCKHRLPQVSITKNILDAVQKIIDLPNVKDSLKQQCIEVQKNEKGVVSTKVLRDIYKTLRNEGETIFLHEMIEGADLVPQQPVLPPRNPELEARIQKLKIEEENKEYERMTRNVQSRGKQNFSFQEDVKSMNRQMIAMLNFALTVVAGFAFGYKGTELVYGNIFAMQMMSGLILGTVVFFVDLYFILRYGV